MSNKTTQQKIVESQAVCQVKSRVLLNAKNDFKNELQNEQGENWDLRLFYDSDTQNFYYPWVFSKTLQHNAVSGFPTKESVDSMITAIKNGNRKSLELIKQSPDTQIKLENCIAQHSFNLIGSDSSIPYSETARKIEDEGSIYEMMEVYGKSLKRDITWQDLESLPSNDVVLTCLNRFNDKTTSPVENGMITNKTLFKGSSRDELNGPYISQFLYLPYNLGNITIDQKYEVEADYEQSSTLSDWLDVQRGKVNGSIVKSQAKYCHTPRVLGSIVHNDPLYQLYQSASLIAFQNGIGPVGYDIQTNSDWTSGGGPFVLSCVGEVSLNALKVAWYHKYGVNLRIRPSVMAQRLNLALTDTDGKYTNHVAGLSQIKNIVESKCSDMMAKVRMANSQDDGETEGTNLLKNQYPEGSPTHPSLPAGHAVVAGACCTVMKALLTTHSSSGGRLPWSKPVKHSVDGDFLVDYNGNTNGMTIIGELNKLASNVSLGRDWAGVHYRCDGDCGLKLGEKVAMDFLRDKRLSIHESTNGILPQWQFENFAGELVTI